MNLFIDANIFLDFYHFSGGDIEELKKLVALLQEGQITLFSCKQLREEIKRNRDGKISESMKELQKVSFKVSFPAFCKQYSAYDDVRKILIDANKKHAELIEIANLEIRKSELAADLLISELLDKSKDMPDDEKTYLASLRRYRMGNPPGKKKVTLGDEMNWESLLKGVPQDEDLFFISGDGDYCSPVDPELMNSFLVAEWAKQKNSKVHFFKSLQQFFKKHFSHIKLASDVKVNSLIEELASSGSFARTHAAIAALSPYTEFSDSQVDDLVEIAELNKQVYWILEDQDVNEFYRFLLDKYGEKIDKDKREKLIGKLVPVPPFPDDVDEEIPF